MHSSREQQLYTDDTISLFTNTIIKRLDIDLSIFYKCQPTYGVVSQIRVSILTNNKQFNTSISVADLSNEIFFLWYLNPSTGQFVEHLFVQRLIRLFRSHRQEYISSNEFVNDFTVCRLALKDNILFLELNHHMFYFPVYVPCLCK